MDVNEHERLSKFTFRHKIKQRNSAVIAVLYMDWYAWNDYISYIFNFFSNDFGLLHKFHIYSTFSGCHFIQSTSSFFVPAK